MQRTVEADVKITSESSCMNEVPKRLKKPFLDLTLWKRGISLLDQHERRMAWIVLGIVILSDGLV